MNTNVKVKNNHLIDDGVALIRDDSWSSEPW